jgi:ribosomal-protein-alanine N-acetyltransferase
MPDSTLVPLSRELWTSRLCLRPLGEADTDALHALWISDGVRRYLWDGETVPYERTLAVVERSRRLFEEEGYGLWGARLTGGSDLMGFAGFWHFHEPPQLELLFGVDERTWGVGYATEMATAVLRYGFRTLGMPVVHASTDAANAASLRVLGKLGFVLTRRALSSGLDTVFYELVAGGNPP